METEIKDLNKGYIHPFAVSISETFLIQVVLQFVQTYFAHCVFRGTFRHLLSENSFLFRFLLLFLDVPIPLVKGTLTFYYVCHLTRENTRCLQSPKYIAFFPFYKEDFPERSWQSIFMVKQTQHGPFYGIVLPIAQVWQSKCSHAKFLFTLAEK